MPKHTPREIFNNDNSSEKKVRTLSLVLTRECNLRCLYCYEKSSHRTGESMDFQTASNAITQFLESEDEFDGVIIDLFGGEPLLQFPLIQEIVQWCRSREWRKKYIFSLSTNGTLLNDAMKKWFAENNRYISMALSIDGNRTAHNLTRNGSYDLVYPHLGFFKENWPYQPAKMTFCAENIPYTAESIIEMEKMELNFTANIAFENFWGDGENKTRLLDIYKQQLARLVEYYVENSLLFPVYPMLGILPAYLDIPEYTINNRRDCVRFCGAGHEMRVVDVDGKQYPCHRFLPWVTGKATPLNPVNCQKSWLPEQCNECPIVQSCPTCAGFNWEQNNDTGIRTTYHCEAHKYEVLATSEIAARRLQKIPVSQLDSMPQREQVAINDRVRSLLFLIENGI